MAVTIDGTNGLTFNNGSTQAIASPLALLATLTPTAATTVESLNVFTSAYDNYLILLQGIQTASATGTCTLDMRFAVAGAVDSNTRYRSGSGATAGGQTFATSYLTVNLGLGTLDATGPGLNASIALQNTNATNSSYKTAFCSIFCNPATVNNTVDFASGYMAYNGTSALSGVSFFLRNGANFVAQGKIRIYGYS
jgi:hypothetical protein